MTIYLKNNKLWVLYLSFIIPHLTYAQPNIHTGEVHQIDAVENIQLWKSYTHNDGLINGEIRSATQAYDGSVWFAGQQGICKYDGKTWTIYTPEKTGAPKAAAAILAAQDSSIWIGSETGITRYYKGNWQTYTQKDGLPGRVVVAIYETQEGDIWVGCGTRNWISDNHTGGLARWNGETWDSWTTAEGLIHQYVNEIFQANDGAIWAATEGGISRFDGQKWTSFTTRNGLPHKRVLAITQSENGDIWIGTENGLARYKNEQWVSFTLEGKKRLVKSLQKTNDGTLWAFSESDLYRFDGQKWNRSRMPIYGPGDIEHAKMQKTKDDKLWLVGNHAVSFNYGETNWLSFRELEGPPQQDQQGNLWFRRRLGGSVTYNIYENNRKLQIHPKIKWPVYVTENGDLWCIRNGEIQTRVNGNWSIHHGILDTLQHMIQTKNKKIWLAGKKSGQARVACYNGESWQTFTSKDWGVEFPGGIKKIEEVKNGDLWFLPKWGSVLLGYGIVRFDGEKWDHYLSKDVLSKKRWAQIDKMTTWDREMSSRVYDLIADPKTGIVWVATGRGLWSHNGTSWTSYEAEGPIDRKVVRVFIDHAGTLWCICADTKKSKGGVFTYQSNTWKLYTMQDGLPSHDIWSIFETKNNTLWLGTLTGVSGSRDQSWFTFRKGHHLPEDDVRYTIQDSTDALWFGKGDHESTWWVTRYKPDQQPPETTLTFTSGDTLASGNITIEWKGKDPWKETREEDLMYSWKLDKRQWSNFTLKKNERISDIKSGHHTFQIRARDQNFNIDPTPAIYTFYIVPPVWQQSWFIGLMVTMLAAIGLQTNRVIRRGRHLRSTNRALQEKTEHLSREITERERLDFQIKNLHFLYTLRASLGEQRTSQGVIQTLCTTIVDALGADGGIIITLDNQPHTFGKTTSYVKTYERDLVWAGQHRGSLILYSPITLSESQERTLLDETTGQLTRILESRELQMQLLQSSRLVSLGQMAAGVAHELNQPLGGISATAEDYYLRLQDNMPVSNTQLKDLFKRILGMVDRMSSTVEHLRMFSRDTSQEPGKPVDLNQVIHSSLDIIGTQLKNHGIEIKLDITEDVPKILGHPYQLEQIFLNLLGNARDALDTQRESNDFFKTITISTQQESNTIIIKVRDNGTGIEPEHLNRIFEPFYTTKPADKGTGLGLSITYAIVKNHGGNISCISHKEHGTTFEVRFPTS